MQQNVKNWLETQQKLKNLNLVCQITLGYRIIVMIGQEAMALN